MRCALIKTNCNLSRPIQIIGGIAACSAAVYLFPFVSMVAASAIGCGYAGKCLRNRCTTPKISERPLLKGVRFPAFELKNSCEKFLLGILFPLLMNNPDFPLPGIENLGEGVFPSHRCNDYVEQQYKISIPLWGGPVERLEEQGFTVVKTVPQEGDIILYYSPSDQSNPFQHVGIVERVTQWDVYVRSKWGSYCVFLHKEEVVPEYYGTAAVYLRKVKESFF